MTNNVFSVLSKYAFRQEENYLTEALAFLLRLLLERNPPAGLDMVNRLCGRDPVSTFTDPPSIAISTQVTTEQGTPDIGIRVGDSTLVYVEAKHDSPLGVGQLAAYLDQLNRSGFPDTRLVLLTRSRSSSIQTTLEPDDYHHLCWYEIYNWLSGIDTGDDVCQYLIAGFMNFLEEKRMSVKRISWEYIQGVPEMLNLADMMEAAISEAMPTAEWKRSGGWHWRGYYLPHDYWFGVRYHEPLLVVFEDNRGYDPVTYRRDLNLEKEHFFSLNKDEQFELLVTFLKRAWEDAPAEVSSSDVGSV